MEWPLGLALERSHRPAVYKALRYDRVVSIKLGHDGPKNAINIFRLAIRKGLTAEELKTTMFADRTPTSDSGYRL